MNPDGLNRELDSIARDMHNAQADLERYSEEWAQKENIYRRKKAITYLTAEGTVDQRKAIVDRDCEKERLAAHLAEGLMKAALENVRNRRSHLSAIQTKSANVKAEMDEARGPQPDWNRNREMPF
jgi:hypothetical protein